MGRYLHIGGVVAVGFDPTGEFLLVITHSGRGVYNTGTWERVARSTGLAYPVGGTGVGIGPIDGQPVAVSEMDYGTGEMRVISPDGRFALECESSGIAVIARDAEPGATPDRGGMQAFHGSTHSAVPAGERGR